MVGVSDGPPLHPDLSSLAGLLGTWRGSGDGEYPTIEPFSYTEEVTFGHVGKPFLAYTQRTRHAERGTPLHAESGYWRPTPGGLEVVIAQPSGLLEMLVGSWDGTTAELGDPEVRVTPTAKDVRASRRTFTLDGDVLRYEMAMAAVGQPMTHHLRAELHRVA